METFESLVKEVHGSEWFVLKKTDSPVEMRENHAFKMVDKKAQVVSPNFPPKEGDIFIIAKPI